MNVGEYGNEFKLNVKEDISSNTALALEFIDPCGTAYTKVAALGTTQAVTYAGTFPANWYAKYTFVQGDVEVAGWWKVRVAVTYAAKLLKTDYTRFEVLA